MWRRTQRLLSLIRVSRQTVSLMSLLDALPSRAAALTGPRGFPLECFVAPPHEEPDFFCSLCKLVMREAVVINGCCGAYFCYQCLRAAVLPTATSSQTMSALNAAATASANVCCPLDGRAFRLEDVFAVDILNRKIRALHVRCHLVPERCAATGSMGASLEFWREHEAVCDYAPLACRWCNTAVVRRDHTRHEHFECARRRVRCVQCGEADVAHADLEQHLRECPSYEVNRLRTELVEQRAATAAAQVRLL